MGAPCRLRLMLCYFTAEVQGQPHIGYITCWCAFELFACVSYGLLTRRLSTKQSPCLCDDRACQCRPCAKQWLITASCVLHNKAIRRTSRSRAIGNKTGELRNAANATGGSRNATDMSNNTAAIKGCSYAAVLVYKYRSKNDVIVKRRSQARMI